MAKRPGRPRIPKTKSRHVLIAVRLAQEEAKRLREAVERAGKTQSEWIRETLLAAA